jgi:hypothetical protein
MGRFHRGAGAGVSELLTIRLDALHKASLIMSKAASVKHWRAAS